MTQRWPVRRALPARLLRRHRGERLHPGEPMITGIRVIDTFFPVVRGDTACIPGACGERAGEVVETITEFPKLADPRTGGRLMDRTIIVCNTSSMPVAAREASLYTGITLGEYYRQMGHDVLMIADSTSRWAQAMLSWSRYRTELGGWYHEHLYSAWNEQVEVLLALLRESDGVAQMMQVTGEKGVSLADFVTYLKATFVDTVYLQQDAFDPVDVTTSMPRQQESLARVHDVLTRDFDVADKEAARQCFTRLTGLFKNLNYAAEGTPQLRDYQQRIDALMAEMTGMPETKSNQGV